MTYKKKFVIALGTVLTSILLVGILSYLSFVQNDQDRWWQRHTHQVLENLDVLYSDLLDAQISLRDYIIAGDDSYVESYRKAVGALQEHLVQLRKLTADNPIQLSSGPDMTRPPTADAQVLF